MQSSIPVQFTNSMTPSSIENRHPRKKSSQSARSVRTKVETVNGVRKEIRTETLYEDGVETVKVYENNRLGKYQQILTKSFIFFFCIVKTLRNGLEK